MLLLRDRVGSGTSSSDTQRSELLCPRTVLWPSQKDPICVPLRRQPPRVGPLEQQATTSFPILSCDSAEIA
jgi:hypothetical protein